VRVGIRAPYLAFVTLTLASAPALLAQEPASIQLGPVTGEAQQGFTELRSMRELSDGRLLVADRREGALYAISFDDGGEVRQVGRRGQGPREYMVPSKLFPIGADSTLLIDGTRTRWLVLRGIEIVDVLTAQAPVLDALRVEGMLGDRAVDRIGVSWSPDAMPGASETADSVRIRLSARPWEAREGLPAIDTLDVVLKGAGAGGIDGCAIAAGRRDSGGDPPARVSEIRTCGDLYPAEDLAVAFDDGWLAVAHVEPYRVSWRSPEGVWTEGPPVELEPVPYTETERCAAAQGWDYRGMGRCEGSEYGMQPPPERYHPFVRDLRSRRTLGETRTVLAAPDGRLLVRRTPTMATVTVTRYDVFDRTGARVGRLRMPADQAILGFGRSTVYTVRTDEVDLQWVRRHDWPPPR